ncbi:protein of unknown function [Xenorhabdus doucetiae]|uniref:Uncharacterized protein n=1 Tax=Xenorhabdus doucetiae TaxID=351671 RepID=A0A068QN56_9GAMM|nr:protein of unknown function [Xenorhabdus doucetiae]
MKLLQGGHKNNQQNLDSDAIGFLLLSAHIILNVINIPYKTLP